MAFFVDLKTTGALHPSAIINVNDLVSVHTDNPDVGPSGKKVYVLTVQLKTNSLPLELCYESEAQRDAAYQKVSDAVL